MIDLGVDKFKLKSALNAVAYQRLLPNKKLEMKALVTYLHADDEALNNNDMHDWKTQLSDLCQKGEITNETKQKYWQG